VCAEEFLMKICGAVIDRAPNREERDKPITIYLSDEGYGLLKKQLNFGTIIPEDVVLNIPSSAKPEFTGKDVNYYIVEVPDPKRLAPYTAECEDIIEALGMTFAEGCAFKALWRSCAARTLGKQKKGQDEAGVYDAEKVEYYGARMVAVRKRIALRKAPKPDTEVCIVGDISKQGKFAPFFNELFISMGLKSPREDLNINVNTAINCDGRTK